ncbi:RDD family protein [Marinomonas gallaica]|uniref:RDD family protein n=1 Tax=Marinomonas gallaica TaxID=1806667 RepID=UPI003CE5B551
MKEEMQHQWVAGFWRRLVAILIDIIIVAMIGFGLGLFVGDFYAQMGHWSSLVGFFLALMYFGIMNSAIAGGQTLGKRLVKICVVDGDNAPISLGRSLMRYLIVGVPFLLDQLLFMLVPAGSYLIYPVASIVFGGMLTTVYLFVFNRHTRQSLHDVVTKTYVVDLYAQKAPLESVWRLHFVVAAALFLAASTLPYMISLVPQPVINESTLRVRSVLLQEANVVDVELNDGLASVAMSETDEQTISYIESRVYLGVNKVGDEAFANRLALTILEQYPEANQKDLIQIILTYGYDIGLGSKWHSEAYNFYPREMQRAE